jgi:hypothetical protein
VRNNIWEVKLVLQRILMVVLILVAVTVGGLYVYKELVPPVEQAAQSVVY